MQFTLRTLLIYFVFVAAALGAFGGWGILVVAVLTAYGLCARRMGFIVATILFTLGTFVLAAFAHYALTIPRSTGHPPRCYWRLREIASALFEYESKYRSLPPAYVADENGKPMHSWRVLILPYLGRSDLYEAYDFDEPWDGPNNSQLGARIVMSQYCCPEDPSARTAGTTSYVAVVGPQTAWPAPDSTNREDLPNACRMVVLVERSDSGIHWMEPRDMTLDEALDGLGSGGRDGIRSGHGRSIACFAFADGSVTILDLAQLDREALRSLLTGVGGEPEDALPWADLYAPPLPQSAKPFWERWYVVFGSSLALFVASGVLLLWTTRRDAGAATPRPA